MCKFSNLSHFRGIYLLIRIEVSQQNGLLGLLGSWHKDEQISNPSLWGEPVCGSIHGLAISTTHTVTLAGGSSRPSSPPDRRKTDRPTTVLVSPVSTPPHQAHGCVLGLSQIGILLMFTVLLLVSSPHLFSSLPKSSLILSS